MAEFKSRPYQTAAIESAYKMIRSGTRKFIMQAPTGAGKTLLSAEIMLRGLKKGSKFLFLAHRHELLNQPYNKLKELGVPENQLSIIKSGERERHRPEAPIQIASIMSLGKQKLPKADVVFVDECHLSAARTFKETIEQYGTAKIIGLSVGPESWLELRGGPFGAGWVGTIEDACGVALEASSPEKIDEYLILRVADLGIQARGWSLDRFEWKKVKSFICHDCDKDVRKIRVAGSSLVTTVDHSLYRIEETGQTVRVTTSPRPVAKLVERRASDICVGDVLPVDDGASWDDGSQEKPIDVIAILSGKMAAQVSVDLSAVTRADVGMPSSGNWWYYKNSLYGHYLPIDLFDRFRSRLPRPTRVYTKDKHWVLPEIMLSSWAYMLGFYLGDGWIDGSRVAFAVENSRVDFFLRKIGELPGFSCVPGVRPTPGASVEVKYNSTIMTRIFHSIFGDAKAGTKFIPGEWVVSWPKEARMELLHGLIDSDGHYRDDGRRQQIFYTTTSLSLARGILSLLRSVGAAGAIHETKPCKGGTINGREIVGKMTRYTVIWSYNAMYGDNSSHKGNRSKFFHGELSFNEAVVRKVEKAVKPKHVYDIEMDGHPSFVANGVLVHNTATPTRLDGKCLGDIYEEILVVAQPTELIRDGYIVKPIVWTVPDDQLPDIGGIKLASNGDFNQHDLGIAVKKRKLVGSIADHWLQRASEKRTICFAVDIEHGNRIVEELIARDHPRGGKIRARIVHAKTPKKERAQALVDLANHDVDVVVNVGLYVEGIDVPSVKCIILARPTESLTVYLQSVGRGCRPWENEEFVLLDHAGNVTRHKMPMIDREYSLDPAEKFRRQAVGDNDPFKTKTCKSCLAVVDSTEIIDNLCPMCGEPFPGRSGGIETLDGTLVLAVEPDQEVERKQFFDKLWMKSYAEGYDSGWVIGKFRDRFGEKPLASWNPPPRPNVVYTDEDKQKDLKNWNAAAYKNKFPSDWVERKYKQKYGEEMPKTNYSNSAIGVMINSKKGDSGQESVVEGDL